MVVRARCVDQRHLFLSLSPVALYNLSQSLCPQPSLMSLIVGPSGSMFYASLTRSFFLGFTDTCDGGEVDEEDGGGEVDEEEDAGLV